MVITASNQATGVQLPALDCIPPSAFSRVSINIGIVVCRYEFTLNA